MAGQLCVSCQQAVKYQQHHKPCSSCGTKLTGAGEEDGRPSDGGHLPGGVNVQSGLPPLHLSAGRVPSGEHEKGTKKRFAGLSNILNSIKGRSHSNNSKSGCSSSELPPIVPGQNMVAQAATSSTVDKPIKQPEQVVENIKNYKQFKDDLEKAKLSGDYTEMQQFFETTFSSFKNINLTFKRDPLKDYKTPEDSGIHQDYVRAVYECILKLPSDSQKTALKAIINSLLKEMKKPRDKNDLRAYLVLLQNSQFKSLSTYVIFAHLLRQTANLCDPDHHFLVHWFKRLPVTAFSGIVSRLVQFISVRLSPPENSDLPPLIKCSWWIPSATKVLALLNAANGLCFPNKLVYTKFYSDALDTIDLMKEYYAWQNPSNYHSFSFCQYPFLLSLQAKRAILQKDSEHQMIMTARRTLVQKVRQHQMPDMTMLFLNLKVRRSHLVSDSLHEIAAKKQDLKKKLRVIFAGEPGLDLGGLTKEWFLLLLRKIFKEEYGMFLYNKKCHSFWFNPSCVDCNQEYNLVGVLMGLAVYNSTILDIRFPQCTYKKLLSPAVVPFNNPRAEVGKCSLNFNDFQHVKPDLAHGLKELLEYDGNVEDDLCMTFEISLPCYGSVKTTNLKPNGDKIPVTNDNRQEYVDLYIQYILNDAIYQQFAAFYHGFHSVCASNALIMLRSEEVEMLVCGNPNLDLDALERVTTYDGYVKTDPTIRYFWETVKGLTTSLQKKLVLFTTGSDRIPIGGMGEMTFKIIKVETSSTMLPMAHTCFNQLILPPYKSRRQLKQKLTIAISNAEGFGLE
ncbi:probable E3 ubiquitin-protein ligase HECTD2 [Antedon mediterranea]|uniref:probable E3 ubiquitin-protein ligase HECTD2 n=1 Tax=Antedon mediterranea TaxID=105859 RepID=UPI003AF69EA7